MCVTSRHISFKNHFFVQTYVRFASREAAFNHLVLDWHKLFAHLSFFLRISIERMREEETRFWTLWKHNNDKWFYGRKESYFPPKGTLVARLAWTTKTAFVNCINRCLEGLEHRRHNIDETSPHLLIITHGNIKPIDRGASPALTVEQRAFLPEWPSAFSFESNLVVAVEVASNTYIPSKSRQFHSVSPPGRTLISCDSMSTETAQIETWCFGRCHKILRKDHDPTMILWKAGKRELRGKLVVHVGCADIYDTVWFFHRDDKLTKWEKTMGLPSSAMIIIPPKAIPNSLPKKMGNCCVSVVSFTSQLLNIIKSSKIELEAPTIPVIKLRKKQKDNIAFDFNSCNETGMLLRGGGARVSKSASSPDIGDLLGLKKAFIPNSWSRRNLLGLLTAIKGHVVANGEIIFPRKKSSSSSRPPTWLVTMFFVWLAMSGGKKPSIPLHLSCPLTCKEKQSGRFLDTSAFLPYL